MLAVLSSAAERPNVVFVITDDQGYGDLSCLGNPILETPAMDALHAVSVRLTNYHVSPTCAPTRGALMSGRYANRAGPWHTIMGRSFLRLSSTTLGEVFRENGYATGLFGKWHLGDNYPFRPEDRGFEEVVRHGGGGVGQTPDYWDNSYFDDVYYHNGVPKQYHGYCTDVYFAEAKRFIERSVEEGRRFLAFVSTNAPHSPFHCPEEYWKPYLEKGLSEKEAIFYGMIANIDENIGELRRWLRERKLDRNTLFIFTTDNGTATGERVFNAGMRGKKSSEYEGGHRVPFFLHWPEGGLAEGRDIGELTAHIDMLPTLIDLCGLERPLGYAIDGRSLAPLLYDLPTPWPDRAIVTDSQRVRDPIKWRKSAVMTERWRLINGRELYDILEDPGQSRDIAARHLQVVSWLRAEYEEWWADIAPGFEVDARIVVGNAAENPARLTAHDWLTEGNIPPWNQAQIRAAVPGAGHWAIHVEQAGRYQISLSRWPSEADTPIAQGMEPGAPVPGLRAFRETPGEPIPASRAILRVGELQLESPVAPGQRTVRFLLELEAGDTELEGSFLLEGGANVKIGAYYATVERL